jgi:hypothetical protein
MFDWTPDNEAVINRFNRLMVELLRGTFNRNCFRPWEVELLLDIEACNLTGSNRRELLRRYQKAVQRHLENGGAKPLKLSEYLAAKRERAKGKADFAGAEPDEVIDSPLAGSEPIHPA